MPENRALAARNFVTQSHWDPASHPYFSRPGGCG